MEQEYYTHARDLIEKVADLQRKVLMEHTAAVLKEMHSQIKTRDIAIESMERELSEYASAAQRLAVEKAELRQALAALMPIIDDWKPINTTADERRKLERAHELVDA